MKTTLRSKELSCPSCVQKIEKALGSEQGVREAQVHFNSGRIEVEHDPEAVQTDRLLEIVRSSGYEAEVSTF